MHTTVIQSNMYCYVFDCFMLRLLAVQTTYSFARGTNLAHDYLIGKQHFCVLMIAGLQPHLAWVTLIRLWLGGAAHLWCRAIMAPRINQPSHTHTGREPLAWQHIPSALAHVTSCQQINWLYTTTTCVLCQRSPAKPLRWRVAGSTATESKQCVLLSYNRVIEQYNNRYLPAI